MRPFLARKGLKEQTQFRGLPCAGKASQNRRNSGHHQELLQMQTWKDVHQGKRHSKSIGLSTMLSCARFLSLNSPTKRILCMSAVPKSFTEHAGHYEIGFAVSDPYLAYARPIDTKYELLISEDYVWSTLPSTPNELIDEIGYRDVDGVALALPMKQETAGQIVAFDDEFKIAREAIRRILGSYGVSLTCFLANRLTLTEAKALAEKDPVIWKDAKLEEKPNQASTHAMVALNAFLRAHNTHRYDSMYEKYMLAKDKPFI